jgi:hypothetical protein
LIVRVTALVSGKVGDLVSARELKSVASKTDWQQSK